MGRTLQRGKNYEVPHLPTSRNAARKNNRAALSRVLNGKAAISPVMALRLEAWLARQTSAIAV